MTSDLCVVLTSYSQIQSNRIFSNEILSLCERLEMMDTLVCRALVLVSAQDDNINSTVLTTREY